ncbi:polysaccharide deacetylase family protein [Fictibacillus nanhaiensis]|uniref:Polysaccharide deacetylase family protein n=1 Tax=Fictibacillus nanhaiensis TaxID=742169 RepID=A0ABS2ZS76_9BACL|nr:polysaccharide deacetylase family protein [Fictibacillus nanhaiensis]
MISKEIRLSFLFLLIGCLFFSNVTHAEIINRFQIEDRGDVIWEVPNQNKQVAITFDDGPDPLYTPQILDVLKENGVHATFFLTGKRMKQYPEIVERELTEGHEIANHTYNHPSFHNISSERVLNEVTKTETLIDPHMHKNYIKLFRPPGGTVTINTINVLKKEGYKIILWSWHQDSRDWTNPGVGYIVNHVLNHIKCGDIILLHDSGGNRQQTVEALKTILPKLKENGYEIVKVDEILKSHPKYDQFLDEIKIHPMFNINKN